MLINYRDKFVIDVFKIFQLEDEIKPMSLINRYIVYEYVTDNRTYHFQAEDETDQKAWLSVLVNCKEGALYRAFDNEGGRAPGSSSLLDLQQAIIAYIQRLPSNDRCCDCNSTNGRCSYRSNDE